MKLRSAAAAAGFAVLCAQGGTAHAGQYTDALSQCLVKSTTQADRTALVVWVYGAMSVHPDIKAYSAMTPAQHQEVTKRAAELFQRLMTADCRAESIGALKYEGTQAFEKAFETLGQVAMEGLVTNGDVAKEMGAIETYVDKSKFESLGADLVGSKHK
jgi:hypothetical protein